MPSEGDCSNPYVSYVNHLFVYPKNLKYDSQKSFTKVCVPRNHSPRYVYPEIIHKGLCTQKSFTKVCVPRNHSPRYVYPEIIHQGMCTRKTSSTTPRNHSPRYVYPEIIHQGLCAQKSFTKVCVPEIKWWEHRCLPFYIDVFQARNIACCVEIRESDEDGSLPLKVS